MAQPAKEHGFRLVIRRTLPFPREKVFAAWLDATGMQRWVRPGNIRSAEVTLDPRVGGKFRILMKGDERNYDHTGQYKVIEPPSKLAFTWMSEGTDQQETLVTLEFFEREKGACEVVLTHERFPRPDKVQAHEKGWGDIVNRLADYLGGRSAA